MNPRLRSILIIIVFVAICASLVGCGRKGAPETPAPEAEAADAV